MLTAEKVNYLINLEKKIFDQSKGIFLSECYIDGAAPIRERLILKNENDDQWIFLWNIEQSSKNLVKLSLHLQENNHYVGLVRVDFNGIHDNPEQISSSVPLDLAPYVGVRFEYNTPHIHVYVDGYKPLAWARPLDLQAFPVQSINNQEDIYRAIRAFGNIINLETSLTINPGII